MGNVHPFHSHEEIRAEARIWVLKFNADTPPTEEEIAALREWVARSAVHRAELEYAQEFWCDADLLSELAVPLKSSNTKTDRNFFGRFFSSLMPLRPAGVAVLLLAVAFTFGLYPLFGTVDNGIYQTAIGEQKTLVLSDQSQIQLDTNSRLRVTYGDGYRQIHLLQGKVYFQVAKDPERPFEVYAGSGMARAVGTAFSVYVTPEDVQVTVDEGRVDLYRVKHLTAGNALNIPQTDNSPDSGDSNGINRSQPPPVIQKIFLSLEKGDSASFNGSGESLSQLAENELLKELSWRRGMLIFTNDPLSHVISEVNRYTSTRIEIADPALKYLKVGGRFKVGELEALFDVLQAGFGIKISYIDEKHIRLHAASSE